MSKMSIDLRKYWDDRLASNLNLKGTGHRAFSLGYNQILYQAQADCLTSLLNKWRVNLAHKWILDVGCGTGFYVDYYMKRGAERVYGIDISETSVKYLTEKFPDCIFAVEDISRASLGYLGSFDFISAISVLYHVIDDKLFEQAIKNLCLLCKPGGYLLISDVFEGRWRPSAQHAHMRLLAQYQPYLENFEVLQIAPIYYFLNRSYIPFIGPKVIDIFRLGKLFYRIDDRLRRKGRKNGNGMKFMLAQRML